jgi:hypothetical protein
MVLSGTPVEVILREAERLRAELLVLGSHGHGLLHSLLVGSVCQGVLRRAPCSVVVVPGRRACARSRESRNTFRRHVSGRTVPQPQGTACQQV